MNIYCIIGTSNTMQHLFSFKIVRGPSFANYKYLESRRGGALLQMTVPHGLQAPGLVLKSHPLVNWVIRVWAKKEVDKWPEDINSSFHANVLMIIILC